MPSQVPDNSTELVAAMFKRGIGSEQLSRETGISVRLIRKYRSGTTVPRDYFDRITENGVKIADALGVHPDELFPPRSTALAA